MKKRLSIIWIFILGFIVGMMTNNLIYMHELEKLINENEILSARLADNLIKINKLENTNSKKKKRLNEILPININKTDSIIFKMILINI